MPNLTDLLVLELYEGLFCKFMKTKQNCEHQTTVKAGLVDIFDCFPSVSFLFILLCLGYKLWQVIFYIFIALLVWFVALAKSLSLGYVCRRRLEVVSPPYKKHVKLF